MKPHLLIAVPPVEVSTESIFRELRPEHWSGPAPDHHVRAIIEGRAGNEHLVNDLEKVALAKWPQICALKRLIDEAGARAVAMTGSGGGVFGLFDSSDDAVRAAGEVRRRASQAHVFTASMLQEVSIS